MRFSITIGAKCDGHAKHDTYVIEGNHSIEEMIEAYKASCKLIGLQISGGDDYTEIGGNQICSKYQKCTATKEEYDQFLKHGLDLQEYSGNVIEPNHPDEYVWLNEPDLFRDLVIDFIKLSLPTLVCEEAYFKNSELKSYITSYNPDGRCIISNLTDSREIYAHFGYGIYE